MRSDAPSRVRTLRCRLAALAGLCGVLVLSPPAPAADSDGAFVVKGAGRASCATFLAAKATQGAEFVSLAGWLDGYLTHVNQSETGTFDIAPWQDVRLLLAAIGRRCESEPGLSFHQAAYQLVDSLRHNRLRSASGFVEAKVGENSMLVPSAIVERIQQRLKAHGYFDAAPDGTYGAGTIAAVRQFQESKGLSPTGMPDQVTLANLL